MSESPIYGISKPSAFQASLLRQACPELDEGRSTGSWKKENMISKPPTEVGGYNIEQEDRISEYTNHQL